MQTVCLRHRRGVIGDRVWKKFGPRRKRESEPSQSKPAALPALPKGELLDGVRNLTAPKKPLPLGEVALRSNDGEGKAISKKKGVFHEGDDGC